VGDTHVGKTTLINRLSGNTDAVTPTVASTHISVTLVHNGQEYPLAVTDTAGQVTYRTLMPTYVRGSEIVVLVFSKDREDSFTNLPDWLNFLDEHVKVPHQVILVCNKVDLTDGIDLVAVATFAENHQLPLADTSATTGQGVEALTALVAAAADRQEVSTSATGLNIASSERKDNCMC
jgi:Ras-related protein Rab-6A